jgi:hypothetical protein
MALPRPGVLPQYHDRVRHRRRVHPRAEGGLSIRFDKVSKYYGDVAAPIDFSLEVDDGEFVVLLGPLQPKRRATRRRAR